MTKIDWTGIGVPAVQHYAMTQGWKRERANGSTWTYTSGTPTNVRITFAQIGPKESIGEMVRALRRNKTPLAEIAARLKRWTGRRAVAENGPVPT